MASLPETASTSPAAERASSLSVLAGPVVPLPAAALEEQLTRNAAAAPERLVLVDSAHRFTAAEVERCANRIARALRYEHGVSPGTVVALFLPRGVWTPIAMAAVLKAGGSFVVLDSAPDAPDGRLGYILRDSRARLLLTSVETAARVPTGAPAVMNIGDLATLARETAADTPLPVIATAEDPAYLVYTSGSTGVPKGAEIPRRAITNLLAALDRILYAPLGPSPREAQTASFVFDAAIQQCLSALATGVELHVLDSQTRRDPRQVLRYLRSHGIQIINVVTSFLLALIDHGLSAEPPPALSRIVTGGEAVTPALLERFYSGAAARRLRLINMYGPAENCTDSTYFTITAETPVADKVPIGRPLPNTRAYVMLQDTESTLQPVARGELGEICVAGMGLARGYVGQPELTSQLFVADPLVPGERMYRTGDLGYVTSDGLLMFAGRRDEQVKIRGYRVELGEVAAVLLSLPGVKEAAVIAWDGSAGRELWAFSAASSGSLSPAELRAALAERLPEYMVPTRLQLLERLPHTGNGKVDTLALAAMAEEVAARLVAGTGSGTSTITAAITTTEAALLAIWREVLGEQATSMDDDFFALGGHSLKAAQITGRIHERLGAEILIAELYAHATVRRLAPVVDAARTDAGQLAPIPRAAEAPWYPLSPAQQSLWFMSQLEGGSVAYNVSMVFEAGAVDADRLACALAWVIGRHEALRTGFELRDGQPVQVIYPADRLSVPIAVHDLTGQPNAEARADELAAKEAATPFDLAEPPLVRAVVIRLAAERARVLLDVHHLVVDGWSLMVLFEELDYAHSALGCGQEPALPPVALQYRDYVAWHAARDFEPATRYWLERLASVPAELALPADPAADLAAGRFVGGAVQRRLAPALVARLEAAARRRGMTLAAWILTFFALLLFKLTRQADLCVGMGAAARTHPDLERMIGYLVNVLPIRLRLHDDMELDELASHVAQACAEALAYQDYPIADLIRRLDPPRRPGRQAVFNVMYAFQSFEDVAGGEREQRLFEPTRLTRMFFDTAKFDLTLFVNRRGEEMLLSLEYSADRFGRATVERYLHALERLMDQALARETAGS